MERYVMAYDVWCTITYARVYMSRTDRHGDDIHTHRNGHRHMDRHWTTYEMGTARGMEEKGLGWRRVT
eukprot:42034-Eustigmatos_ZCMA.PRE.1